MKHAGLWDAASTRERILLEKPLGSWSRQEITDGQWREESPMVLLWALRPDMTMPPYDEQAFQSEVMKSVPHPMASQAFISNAKFRDSGDIRVYFMLSTQDCASAHGIQAGTESGASGAALGENGESRAHYAADGGFGDAREMLGKDAAV